MNEETKNELLAIYRDSIQPPYFGGFRSWCENVWAFMHKDMQKQNYKENFLYLNVNTYAINAPQMLLYTNSQEISRSNIDPMSSKDQLFIYRGFEDIAFKKKNLSTFISNDDKGAPYVNIVQLFSDINSDHFGVLGVNFSGSKFSWINSLKNDGIDHAWLVFKNGLILRSTTDKEIGTNLLDNAAVTKVLGDYININNSDSIYKDSTGIRTISIRDGSDYIYNITKITIGTEDYLLFISRMGKQYASSIVFNNLSTIATLIGICFVLGFLIALYTSTNIAKPIKQLTKALNGIAHGEKEIVFPTDIPNDELGNMIVVGKNYQELLGSLVTANIAAQEANKAKSEFLTNMSHELRTPMHAMMSYSKLGLEQVEKDSKAYKCFVNIVIAGNRLLKLINKLLDLSKLESGKLEISFEQNDILICINGVVEEFASLFREKKLKVKLLNKATNTFIYTDYQQLFSVFANIFSNAIKFSPQEGMIEINIYDHSAGADGMVVDSLEIRVRDHGPGIPQSDLEKVFEAFVMGENINKNSGTGLGLAIVKRIIELHCGKIWAENAPDGGAIICISIPKVCDISKNYGSLKANNEGGNNETPTN